MKNNIDTIVFDLGGVLLDWNPEYVYIDVFNGDQEKVDWFLNNICTFEWNVQQDAGITLKEATEVLVDQYPEYETWIRIYYDRWEDMLGGVIQESVDLFKKLKSETNYRLIALTNWSAETFPVALRRFKFLIDFEGIVVSGKEKTIKPHSKIYEILISRYQLSPQNCVFIDDNLDNVKAAEKIGFKVIHFESSQNLKKDLIELGVEIEK